MWNLFNQRRELDTEVFAKLRPGDLFGSEQQATRRPEYLVRYLVLANASVLTFFAVVLSRVATEMPAYPDIYAAVWLTAVGIAIATGAWTLLKLSRQGEAQALTHGTAGMSASELPPAVRALMKKAAVKKLLAIRILIVSALSGCIGLYLGLKGLFLL
jgi:hypothetical protein